MEAEVPLRDFHDASADFVPPTDAQWNVVIPPDSVELIAHHDPAPWNVVVGADRWVVIDWDNAGPGSRLWTWRTPHTASCRCSAVATLV